MDGGNVHRLWQPIRQLQVESPGRSPPDPLAVAHDDVEVRLLIAKIQKDLIVVGWPGDLMHFDGDASLLFEVFAQFLQTGGRIPLGPPYSDGFFLPVSSMTH